jgi:hypothetical protein
MSVCTECTTFHVTAGDGIDIEGSGTPTDPFIISAELLDFEGLFTIEDTDTVNLILTGSGVTGDPFLLRAQATIPVEGLSNIYDLAGPAVGESIVYMGSGQWEFAALPPSPAGATNVENGLSGVGSVGDPVKVETSGVWGVGALSGLGGDSTIGLPIYVDSAGDLRARPALTTVAWGDVTGKPTTFTPAAHTHPVSELTDLTTNGSVRNVDGKRVTIQATSAMPASAGALHVVLFPKGS